jgi:hypothetical protein
MRIDVAILALVIIIFSCAFAAEKVFSVHYDDARPDDMTTWVTSVQYPHGSWRFTNNSDQHLMCQLGLTDPPRWSTSLPPISPKPDKPPVSIRSTVGQRNFELEPNDSFSYARNDVGTLYCEIKD